MTTFTLTIGPDVALTIRAEDSGRIWNGFAVPILTAEQAAIVGAAIGEPLTAGPSEGLTWEAQPCGDCGMPHTAEHSCEPINWTYGEA
jgi:hypothetical protein